MWLRVGVFSRSRCDTAPPPSARQKFQTVRDVYLVTGAEHGGGGIELSLLNNLGMAFRTGETFVCGSHAA